MVEQCNKYSDIRLKKSFAKMVSLHHDREKTNLAQYYNKSIVQEKRTPEK